MTFDSNNRNLYIIDGTSVEEWSEAGVKGSASGFAAPTGCNTAGCVPTALVFNPPGLNWLFTVWSDGSKTAMACYSGSGGNCHFNAMNPFNTINQPAQITYYSWQRKRLRRQCERHHRLGSRRQQTDDERHVPQRLGYRNQRHRNRAIVRKPALALRVEQFAQAVLVDDGDGKLLRFGQLAARLIAGDDVVRLLTHRPGHFTALRRRSAPSLRRASASAAFR